MFGTNPVAKSREIEEGFLVHSIFYTIQGEGPFAGEPAIFLRLAGCNLRCSFCDTEFVEGAVMMTDHQLRLKIIEMSDEHDCDLVVITGGEPMLQPLGHLIPSDTGFIEADGRMASIQWQIETAGTVWPEGLEKCLDYVSIVCSPKTPKLHPMIVELCRTFKYIIIKGEGVNELGLPHGVYMPDEIFVLDDNEERVPLRAWQDEIAVFVQPCDEQDDVKNEANMKLAVDSCLSYGYRLSIQLHKIAGLQ